MQPAAYLRAAGREVMPAVGEADPAGAHRARGIHVIPGAVHPGHARVHHAAGGVQVVPGTPVVHPAPEQRAGGRQVEPVVPVADPAGGHVAVCVEVVAAAPDCHPLGGGVGAIGAPPPPADRVAHPRSPTGFVRGRHRRRFGCDRRGRGTPFLLARTGVGGLGRARGWEAGRRGRRRLAGGLSRGGTLCGGLRRGLLTCVSAGLCGQGDEGEGQGCDEGARGGAAGVSGRRCHGCALSLDNSSPISVGRLSQRARAFGPSKQTKAGLSGMTPLSPALHRRQWVSPQSRARRPAGPACARGARSRRLRAWVRRAWGAQASGP